MNRNPIELIDGYFDDVLTDEEHEALTAWIKSDFDHVKQFAEATMLHDRMRAALVDLGKEQNDISTDRVSRLL